MKRVVLLTIALFSLGVFAQGSCTAIREAQKATYGFRPSKVDEKTRDAKSAAMDSFWELVKKEMPDGVACLQDLLAEEKSDPFFLFDGSSLLFSLDQSERSGRIVEEAVYQSDLNEIDPAGYVRLLLQLSFSDVDTGRLASRYLEHPNVTAYVPQHALTLDRSLGAVFLYGSMTPERADGYLTSALDSENKETRDVAALTLALSMTEAGFKALTQFQGLKALPEPYAKQVRQLRTYSRYEPPKQPPKFSREEVLEYIRLIPHTEEEFHKALDRQEEYEKRHPEPDLGRKADSKGVVAAVARKIEEAPPFLGIAGAKRFIESAVANLSEKDLPMIREARRSSLQGLSDENLYEYFSYTQIIEGIINRLDLYKDYRIHQPD